MPSSKARALGKKRLRKNKGFKGTQYQDMDDSNTGRGNLGPIPSSCSSPLSASTKVVYNNASKKKLLNSSFEEIDCIEKMKTRETCQKIGLSVVKKLEEVGENVSLVQMACLQQALASAVICKSCKSAKSELKLLKDDRRKHGLAELFMLKCSVCDNETSFYSSKKVANGVFEVNKRSVMACNSLKGGRQTLSDFCAVMNLPTPLAVASFARHSKAFSKISQEEAERKMKQAATRIRESILKKNPIADKQDGDNALPVAISIDGTWHRRGYSSKYGVVVAILVDTGEVVDVEVLSKHCFECKKHQNDDKESGLYKNWQEAHKSRCQINYDGSSGGMEGAGALAIFKRSIDQRQLKYTTFVGDGDSDTFKVVKEGMNEMYGTRYQVTKEECIGHIQKRMGNAIRRYVKDMKGKKCSDNKTVGGKGRLTKVKIDQIQRNYGKAIRSHSGNLKDMQNAIWAIFHHMIKPPKNIPLKKQHSYCPKGKDSWCKFNNDLKTKKKTYSESQRLPCVFSEPLKPIFHRLAATELLQKCLKGLTQNPNESFNNLIWQRCPKTMFCSKDRIVSAVSEAVCVFNTGAGAKALILRAAGIKDVGTNALLAWRSRDKQRLASASQKVQQKYKTWRVSRKTTMKEDKKKENEHYEAGAFDSTGVKLAGAKRKSQNTTRKAKKPRIQKK